MKCPSCNGAELREFFDGGDVPVFCSVLYDSSEEARRAPRGRMRLGFCPSCALVFNTAYDERLVEYAAGYENSLHGSPSFQAFAERLADELVESYDLRGARVLEIGGGRGEFLCLLHDRGVGASVIFDPCIPSGAEVGQPYEVVREYFGRGHLEGEFRLVLSRHVIEHVPEPRTFVAAIATSLQRRPGAALYLELPNGLWTFRDLGIWDLIYEHCSYMAPVTVEGLLRSHGLACTVTETFGAQFLSAHARFDEGEAKSQMGNGQSVAEIEQLIDAFATLHDNELARWNAHLEDAESHGQRVAIWGAGAKGVTFLNALRRPAAIQQVVDVNTLKFGRFVPGTGHEVVSPESLVDSGTDEIVVMNPRYLAEIRAMVTSLGIRAEVVPVG